MKKMIIAVTVLGLLFVAYFEYNSYQQKKYEEIFTETVVKMVVGSNASERICKFYSKVWSDAIYKEGNYWAKGYLYKDPNDALIVARKEYNWPIRSLKFESVIIKQNMGKLINPPSKYKDVYLVSIKLYGYANEYLSLADSPTGSLTSFNQKTAEISSNISKLRDEIIIQLPKLDERISQMPVN